MSSEQERRSSRIRERLSRLYEDLEEDARERASLEEPEPAEAWGYMDSMQGGYLPDLYQGPYESREECVSAALADLEQASDNAEEALWSPEDLERMRRALDETGVLYYSGETFIGRDRVLELIRIEDPEDWIEGPA